jgi:hypothetical protein
VRIGSEGCGQLRRLTAVFQEDEAGWRDGV